MTNPSPPPTNDRSVDRVSATPWRCFTGALISSALATALYLMTQSVIITFAHKPVTSTNPTVINIGVAVRTLVTGLCALGTFVFAISTLGLIALGIQLFWQQLKEK